MTIYAEGVDYAWQRPSISALVSAGKTFACRYGGPGSDGKQIDAAEVAALTSHGIAVVANAEGSAGGFVGSAAGASWARQARDHFTALGMPADRPIYFSVDFGVTAADYPGVDAALRAAAGVIGAANVGVYGSYALMRHCKAAGTARWFWQTLAWSGGKWATDINHIEQYRNAVGLGGAVLDLDRAVKSDYGQWGVDDMALDSADHTAIRNDTFLGAGYDVGQAFVRATTGDPADATATDRGIRNGWDAGMSFAIQSEYNAIMAGIGNVLTALTSKATADDVLAQINAARDVEIAAAKQRFDQAAAEMAAARTEIAGVDEAVIAKLGDPNTPNEVVAAALVELLGDRKDAVLALMQ